MSALEPVCGVVVSSDPPCRAPSDQGCLALPVELLRAVLEFVDPSSLAVALRSCQPLLELGRPILYHDVSIRGIDRLSEFFCERPEPISLSLQSLSDLPDIRSFCFEDTWLSHVRNLPPSPTSSPGACSRPPASSAPALHPDRIRSRIPVQRLVIRGYVSSFFLDGDYVPYTEPARARVELVDSYHSFLVSAFDPEHFAALDMHDGPPFTRTPLFGPVQQPWGWTRLQRVTLRGVRVAAAIWPLSLACDRPWSLELVIAGAMDDNLLDALEMLLFSDEADPEDPPDAYTFPHCVCQRAQVVMDTEARRPSVERLLRARAHEALDSSIADRRLASIDVVVAPVPDDQGLWSSPLGLTRHPGAHA